jgi:hypothetical protein
MSSASPISYEQINHWVTSPNELVAIGGEVQLPYPIQLPPTGKAYMDILGVTLTNNIPNIFSWQGFSNRKCRVKTTDAGGVDMVPWTNIVLNCGKYGPTDIAAAINSAISEIAGGTLWTSDLDPGFAIGYNTVTSRIWLTIDDSKLNPARGVHFWFDMSQAGAGSDLSYTMGWSELKNPFTPIMPGIFISFSDQCSRTDSQGVGIKLLNSMCPERPINQEMLRLVAEVPIAESFSSATPTIQWPVSGITPRLVYNGSKMITSYRISSLSGRANESRTLGFPVVVQQFGLVCSIQMQLYS